MSKKRIVLADVARKAGVSGATASAVLHKTRGNNTRFCEKTRDKVRSAAAELGYRANRTFRNLNRNRQGVIGVVLGANALISTYTLNSMSEAAAKRDLMLIYSHADGETPVFIKEDAVDGLLLFGDTDAEFQSKIDTFKIPVIYINSNRRLEGGSITFDEKGGVQQAVHFLKQQGRQKIALIERYNRPGDTHYSSRLRWEGIRQYSEELNMDPPERYMLKNRLHADLRKEQEPGCGEPLVRELCDFIRKHPDVDAMILNYRILAPVAYEAARRCDKRFPEDLSVIGINPFDPIDFAYPYLTSITLDFTQLAKISIEQMIKLIEQGAQSLEAVSLPMRLVIRDSA